MAAAPLPFTPRQAVVSIGGTPFFFYVFSPHQAKERELASFVESCGSLATAEKFGKELIYCRMKFNPLTESTAAFRNVVAIAGSLAEEDLAPVAAAVFQAAKRQLGGFREEPCVDLMCYRQEHLEQVSRIHEAYICFVKVLEAALYELKVADTIDCGEYVKEGLLDQVKNAYLFTLIESLELIFDDPRAISVEEFLNGLQTEVITAYQKKLLLSPELAATIGAAVQGMMNTTQLQEAVNELLKPVAMTPLLSASFHRYKSETLPTPPFRKPLVDFFPSLSTCKIYLDFALERHIGRDRFYSRDYQCKKRATFEERLYRKIPLMGSYSPQGEEKVFPHDLTLDNLLSARLPEEEGITYETGEDRIRFPDEIAKEKLHPYPYAVSHSIGRRQEMQDVHYYDILQIGKSSIYAFGVLDGHGEMGLEIAKAVRNCIGFYLQLCLTHATTGTTLEELDPYLIEQALTLGSLLTNEAISQTHYEKYLDSGTTMILSLIIGKNVWTVCVGDSRALMVRAEELIQLSEDADAGAISYQKSAIKREGAITFYYGHARVDNLGPARNFGDFNSKATPARPKIHCTPLGSLLILGCDGMFETVSSKQLGALILALKAMGKPLSEITRLCIRYAYLKGSNDNLSCMIVDTSS